MTVLSLLGLISSLGAIAALVLLSCRGAEEMTEPEADGGVLDVYDGISAWPDAYLQSGRMGRLANVWRENGERDA